jgi:hypothetical protein
MNLNDAPLGNAFEGDYPENYGNLTRRYQQILQRQVDELDRTSSSSGPAEILGILKGRRSARDDLAQLEIRSRADGSASLLGRGEIVMPAKSCEAEGVADLMRSRGFTERTPHTDYVRWRQPTRFRDGVERLLEECSALGAESWPNYVATLAAVGKGIGGPEPVPGPGSFADYRIPTAPEYYTGPGPRVAVIDTGIPSLDPDGGHPGMRRGDAWLSDIPRTDSNRDLLDDLPAGPDGSLDFHAGHGTFVAGIIQRVAPGADIQVYRAADSDGFATDGDIANALLQAVDDGARIVNLSLGARTADDRPPRAMATAVWDIRRKSGDDVVIVAAAGNYGDKSRCWPAALDGVEAVAGLTAQLAPASWSSCGEHIRFSTVAEGIRSTFVTGRESPVFDPEPEEFPQDAWALWSGTSFATPQIAGAVARICHELTLNPRQAVDKLHERGRPIAGFGKAMRILEGIR